MICAACKQKINQRSSYAHRGRGYFVCGRCIGSRLDHELVERLGWQLRQPRCPSCHGELGCGLFQCETCDLQTHDALVREAWRQDDAIEVADRRQRFREIFRLRPLIWNGYCRVDFMQEGCGLYHGEKLALHELGEFAIGGRWYPTGSRYICPDAVRPDSDWDVIMLTSGVPNEVLQKWLCSDGSNGGGDSLRFDRLNAILFYDGRHNAQFEAFRAATVWCKAHGGPTDKQQRIDLFKQAERERWNLTELIRCE